MRFLKHIPRPYLLPLTPAYGLIVLLRNLLYDIGVFKSIACHLPVISIGNITVGGTGKTPHVEFLIRRLSQKYRLAVLSRGYKRKNKGFVLASSTSGVNAIGDEPLQIKSKFTEVPVAVDTQRVRGIQKLEALIPELRLVIMDDGYQHRKVKAGLSVLLISYVQPIFSDILLPAGNLREPRRNIKRADVLIVSKCPLDLTPSMADDFAGQLHLHPHQKIFFTGLSYGEPLTLLPDPINLTLSLYTAALIVTGIANPNPLIKFLSEKISVENQIIYPDHHSFTKKDLEYMIQLFEEIKALKKIIITTEKDAIRLREVIGNNPRILHQFVYIPVEVTFLLNGEQRFLELVIHHIENQ